MLVFSLAGIALVCRLAKLWFARPRPGLFPVIGEIPLDASYPSAHTARNRGICGDIVLGTKTGETGAYLFLLDGNCPDIGIPGCPLPHLSSGSFPFGCSGWRLAGLALDPGFI